MDKILAFIAAVKMLAQVAPMQPGDRAHIMQAADDVAKYVQDLANLRGSAIAADAHSLWDFITHGGNMPGTPESRAAAAAAQVTLHPSQPAPVVDPRDAQIAELQARVAQLLAANPQQ